jgi:positive regulator of sigma E activity
MKKKNCKNCIFDISCTTKDSCVQCSLKEYCAQENGFKYVGKEGITEKIKSKLIKK